MKTFITAVLLTLVTFIGVKYAPKKSDVAKPATAADTAPSPYRQLRDQLWTLAGNSTDVESAQIIGERMLAAAQSEGRDLPETRREVTALVGAVAINRKNEAASADFIQKTRGAGFTSAHWE